MKMRNVFTGLLFECIAFYFPHFVAHCAGLKLEAVPQRCSVKRVFLEISQNSQQNTCARVSYLIKL